MAETLTHSLENYLSAELVVFIISMLPILELRGGLIAASLLGLPWKTSIVISLVGNILPIPFLLLFIRQILRFMIQHGIFKRFALWAQNKGMTKGAELMEKHPRKIQFALFLFVAIPLPGTGGWTGALIASLLGLKIKDSALPICLGIAGAAVIMSVATYLIPMMMGLK